MNKASVTIGIAFACFHAVTVAARQNVSDYNRTTIRQLLDEIGWTGVNVETVLSEPSGVRNSGSVIDYLDLHHRTGLPKIRFLPERIGNLVNLEVLILDGNELDSLPSSLANTRRLTVLKIADNVFSSLPSWLGEL